MLLTGAAGFIGSNLACYLVKHYPDIMFIGLDRFSYCSSINNIAEIETQANWQMIQADLTDKHQVWKVFADGAFDTIIHLAAYTHVDHSFSSTWDEPDQVHLHGRDVEDSIQFTYNNVLATHILLEAARQYKIERFIHVSTDEVYGSKEVISSEDTTLDPTNPYAATKAAAEHLVKAYYHSFKLPIVIVRCNNVYGPKQFPEKVIPRFILRLRQGLPCQIQGSGKQVRSFLYVDDVSRAFETILFKGEVGLIYNIGTVNEYSVHHLATKLIQMIHPDDPDRLIEYIADRHFNDQRYFIDSRRLNELGWSPQVSFDEGLKRTIAWYDENDNWPAQTSKVIGAI